MGGDSVALARYFISWAPDGTEVPSAIKPKKRPYLTVTIQDDMEFTDTEHRVDLWNPNILHVVPPRGKGWVFDTKRAKSCLWQRQRK